MLWTKVDETWSKRKDLQPGQEVESGVTFKIENWDVPGEEPLSVRVCTRKGVALSKFCNQRDTVKTSIVLHLTAGYGNFSGLMGGADHGCSAHFLLGRDGHAYLLVPTNYVAWHATWWNENSVGIEVDNIGPLRDRGESLTSSYGATDIYCKKSDAGVFVEKSFRGTKYWAAFTEPQYATLARLIKAISHKHQIPLYVQPEESRYKPFNKNGSDRDKFRGICSHLQIDPANRADIGPYIDWSKLIRLASLTEGDCFNAPPYQPPGEVKPAAAEPPKAADEPPPEEPKAEAKDEPEAAPVEVKDEPAPKAEITWEQVEHLLLEDNYKLVGDFAGGFADADLQLILDHYCGEEKIPSSNLGADGLPVWLTKWQEKIGGGTNWDKVAQGRSGLAEAFSRAYFRQVCREQGTPYSPANDELFAELFKSEKNGKLGDMIGMAARKPAPPKKKEGKKEEAPAAEEESQKWHAIPPRPDDALSGSKFFEALGNKSGPEREEAALAELNKGNIPNFLRKFVEVKVSCKGHKGSVYVSPDALAIGSDDDFVRIPLTPLTAQQAQDFFKTTFVTAKLSDDIHAAAEVKLEPIPQPPGKEMHSNGFYLEHNRKIEAARSGKKLGALTSGVKKDVVLSVKLNNPPQKSKLGERAVVIYGWHQANGKPIQGETDIHDNAYVDYSHGIRLVSQKMIVDGKPMSIFDVLKSRELAPLVLKAADLADPSFPPPPRYKLALPGQPNKGSGAGEEAEVKESEKKEDEKQSSDSELASAGEKEALNLGPKKEPKLKPLVDKYKQALAKAARDLSKEEACIILAFLHHAGFLSLINGWANKARKAPVIDGENLKWPTAGERIGFGPWVKFKDEGEPLPEPGASKLGPIAGHFGFVTNLMANKAWSRQTIKEKTTPCVQLDPRSAVALYRTANWLFDTYACSELHHAGVNGADPKIRNDCHGQGRALDFAGVTGKKDGKDFEYFIIHDWGNAKVPAGQTGKSDHDWIAKDGVTSYRMADRLEEAQPSPARFHWDFYKFLAAQWRCDGMAELPKSFEEKCKGGFIMHPDHPTSKPGTANGREAHQNHIHCQIGDTGAEK